MTTMALAKPRPKTPQKKTTKKTKNKKKKNANKDQIKEKKNKLAEVSFLIHREGITISVKGINCPRQMQMCNSVYTS